MARILAIDYGQRRTGLAVTDPLQIIAAPLTTVETAQLKDFISNYLQSENVEKIIIGLPVRTDGSLPPFAQEIYSFAEWIRQNFPHIAVEFIDEHSTSKRARQALIQGGFRQKTRRKKQAIDQMAATLILREYLGIY